MYCRYRGKNQVGYRVNQNQVLPILNCLGGHDTADAIKCSTCNDFSESTLAKLEMLLPKPEKQFNSPAKIKVGVYTAPRKVQTLKQTVESLYQAGFDKNDLHIFYDACPVEFPDIRYTQHSTKTYGFPSFCIALNTLLFTSGREPGKLWDDCAYMMVQDDCEFVPYDLKNYLLSMLYPSDNFGFMSLFTSCTYTNEAHNRHLWAQKPCWHKWDHSTGQWVWSGQCLLFSRQSALAFLQDQSSRSASNWYFSKQLKGSNDVPIGLCNIDHTLGYWAKENNYDVWQCSRSFIKHIGETSAMWSARQTAGGSRQALKFVGDP